MLRFYESGHGGFARAAISFDVPGIRSAVAEKKASIDAYVISDSVKKIELSLSDLTDDERKIILSGCLINFYRDEKNSK